MVGVEGEVWCSCWGRNWRVRSPGPDEYGSKAVDASAAWW